MSKGGKNKGMDKLPKGKKIDTREELGKIAGVSKNTGLLAKPPKEQTVNTRVETAKLANTSSHKVREVDTVLKHGTTEQVKRQGSVWILKVTLWKNYHNVKE